MVIGFLSGLAATSGQPQPMMQPNRQTTNPRLRADRIEWVAELYRQYYYCGSVACNERNVLAHSNWEAVQHYKLGVQRSLVVEYGVLGSASVAVGCCER